MNKVVKAENEKIAALDYANAVERQADGEKRSEIKKAEGVKQAKILAAQGEAEAIRLVNEAAKRIVPLATIEHLRQSETDFAKLSAREIGDRGGAEQVLWIEVRDYLGD